MFCFYENNNCTIKKYCMKNLLELYTLRMYMGGADF